MNFPMLSGVMITYNEVDLVDEILELVTPHVDEMVVLDGGSEDGTLEKLQRWKEEGKIVLYKFPFMKREHFGDQKNLAVSLAKGRWIFLVDPDERFEENLLESLNEKVAWCEENKADCIEFPRKNFIDGVQTDEYPDYQARLYRSYLRWIYRVHEELVGFRKKGASDHHFLHYKTEERQKKQWIYYDKLVSKYDYCMFDWRDTD